MNEQHSSAGQFLRDWRQRRRLSQLDLASEAEISQRHLSFLESGRAAPSREMVLRLAEHLRMPLREQNRFLTTAGFAPLYQERPLDAAEMKAARDAIDAILTGHEPYPALAVDRQWSLVSMNRAVPPLLQGVSQALLAPPVNVLRLSLHPDGLAPRIHNFRQWRNHVIERLTRQIENTADTSLTALREELAGYKVPPGAAPYREPGTRLFAGLAVPLELTAGDGVLKFISTTTVFGTATDVSLSELAIESFFPADEATAAAIHAQRGS